MLSAVRTLKIARERTQHRPGRGDRGSGIILGSGALLAATAFAVLGPRPTTAELGTLLLLTVLFGLALRTEIVLPGGGAVPTQPILVGLLLTGPPSLAPAAVLIGLHLAEPEVLLRPGLGPGERVLGMVVRSHAAWSCLAPAAVLWAAGPPRPSLANFPLYLVAFATQVLVDGAVALIRAVTLSVAPRTVLPGLAWTFCIDALLAPIGLCVVLAADGATWPLIVLIAPTGLVRLMVQDRTRQLETAVTLGAAYEAVHEEARVDALTGLLNRRAWREAVAGRGAGRAGPGECAGVLIADVDGLKRINDTLGHEAGDQLIRTVADLLSAVAPAGSVIARLGGDEFGMLVPCPPGEASSAGDCLLTAIRAAMAASPGVGGEPVSCSLGWAASPPLPDVAEAARQADLLAGEDKRRRGSGRDRPQRRADHGQAPAQTLGPAPVPAPRPPAGSDPHRVGADGPGGTGGTDEPGGGAGRLAPGG